MSDETQRTISSTTQATSSHQQGHVCSQPSHQQTTVVEASVQTLESFLSQETEISPMHDIPQPVDFQYPAASADYCYQPTPNAVEEYVQLHETSSIYSDMSPLNQPRPVVYVLSSRQTTEGRSRVGAHEQWQSPSQPQLHVPHQTDSFCSYPPPAPAVLSAPPGIQFHGAGPPPGRLPAYPSHNVQYFDTVQHQVQPVICTVQGERLNEHLLYLPGRHQQTAPPSQQQQRVQNIKVLEEQVTQIQQQLEATKLDLEREKQQLALEQHREQGQLYQQQQQQQRLSQQSSWLLEHNTQEFSIVPVIASSLQRPPAPVPMFPVQPSAQGLGSPFSSQQTMTPSVPYLRYTVASELTQVPFRAPVSGTEEHSHQVSDSDYSTPAMTTSVLCSARDVFPCFVEFTDLPEFTQGTPSSATDLQDPSTAALPTLQFRSDFAEFGPSENPKRHHTYPYKQRSYKARSPQYHSKSARTETKQTADPSLQIVRKKLRKYALRVIAPFSDPDDQDIPEAVKQDVIRVPAVCFNEQKFVDKRDYQVLVQPQSPAIRGQEALSRVCFALEKALRLRETGAAIISDYKFRENYLRRAPEDVLSMLNRPEDEGSHNILMIGPEIGIVCIQVTCVEASTNSGTVKKQVRDTLKQLQKDTKVIRHVLEDLDLDANCIHMVMALPNVTTDLLKQKLDLKYLKILSSALNTTDDLEDLLTLDCLPYVGHRHWISADSRSRLWQWFDRLAEKKEKLSVENYMQIFARYTCGWSVPEVWSAMKPRVQIRSWAHAIAETYRRFHLPVLTPRQDDLLHSGRSHLLIDAPTGTGATCLLKVKAVLELRRGCLVFLFVPQHLTALRNEYEQLVKSDDQFSQNLFFWSDEDKDTGNSRGCFKSVCGTFKSLDGLRGHRQETFAVFDHANHQGELLSMVAVATDVMTSVWVLRDAAVSCERMPREDEYFHVQLSTVTRLPSTVQALINHADVRELSDRTSTGGPSMPDHQSKSLTGERQPRPGSDISHYQGLPTDGPVPLFIWHPVNTSTPTESGIFGCQLCMNQLRTALRNLVHEFIPLTDTAAEKGATAAAVFREAQKAPDFPVKKVSDFPVRQHRDSTDVTPGSAAAADEEKEREAEEVSIDINSGNVPPPLTADDVIIFVDRRKDADALLKKLDLVNVDKAIHLLADLPHLLGTEKAVVVYVGRLTVGLTDAVSFTLVSKLREAMALCQGQLILAVDLQIMSEPDRSRRQSTGSQTPADPFQLDFDDMLMQAKRQHNH